MSNQGAAGATSPRLSGRQYRELFEESHDAILITQRDGVILDANHAASELFAWPHADFIGMNVRRIYANAEDRARFQEQIEREGFVRDFEVVCVTRDGRRLDCLMTTVVRRAPDGSVSGYQGIVRDISERKQLERERREYHDQLRSLATELVVMEDRERRRIALDLHDRIGQILAVSQIKVEALRQAAGGERQVLLDDLHGLLDQMNDDVRSLISDLSPPVLHDLGLVPGLQSLAGRLEQELGLRVRIESEGDCEVPDRDLRASLYRCIRELLLNVTRHAGTDAAGVALLREGTELSVVVEDRGRGFDPHPEGIRHRFGFGLFSIRECMTQAGGSFHIESTPGRGTRCRLTVPGQGRKRGSR